MDKTIKFFNEKWAQLLSLLPRDNFWEYCTTGKVSTDELVQGFSRYLMSWPPGLDTVVQRFEDYVQ